MRLLALGLCVYFCPPLFLKLARQWVPTEFAGQDASDHEGRARVTLTVKGFAKPVRTYSVVGLYDDLADQGRIIRKEQDGLALVIDRNKLTKKGKAEAIIALEEATAQLKG